MTGTSYKLSAEDNRRTEPRDAIFNRIAGIKSYYKAVKAMKSAGDKNFLFAVNALAEECLAFHQFAQEINRKVKR